MASMVTVGSLCLAGFQKQTFYFSSRKAAADAPKAPHKVDRERERESEREQPADAESRREAEGTQSE